MNWIDGLFLSKAQRYAVRLARRTDFYETQEWYEVRYKALRKHGAKCQCCGRTRKDGIVIHVDHIKPRSKFPWLALTLNNLQITCHECNKGKSNKFCDDWR